LETPGTKGFLHTAPRNGLDVPPQFLGVSPPGTPHCPTGFFFLFLLKVSGCTFPPSQGCMPKIPLCHLPALMQVPPNPQLLLRCVRLFSSASSFYQNRVRFLGVWLKTAPCSCALRWTIPPIKKNSSPGRSSPPRGTILKSKTRLILPSTVAFGNTPSPQPPPVGAPPRFFLLFFLFPPCAIFPPFSVASPNHPLPRKLFPPEPLKDHSLHFDVLSFTPQFRFFPLFPQYQFPFSSPFSVWQTLSACSPSNPPP